MRILPFVSLPISLLAACATIDDADPDEAAASAAVSTPTQITIRSVEPPGLVAYRDIGDPVWHTAEQKAPNRFVAKVHGPYWLTVVCVVDVVSGGTVVGHTINVTRAGNTLGDGAALAGFCAKPGPTTRDVSGHMAQAGQVMIGGNAAASTVDDWTFQIPVLKGSYTLYAASADRIVIRRGLQAQRSVVIAPIDASVEGNLLAPVSFTATNGVATRAVVRVSQHGMSSVGQVSGGAPEAVRAIPTAVLTPDDNQTVSLQELGSDSSSGFTRTALRASRRPWRIGDDATFALPAPFGDPQWSVDGDGDDVAAWSSLPGFTLFFAQVFGSGLDPSNTINDAVFLTPSFAAQTFINQVAIDSQIPGFLPAWRIDRSSGYFRTLETQHADLAAPEDHTVETTLVSDFVPPPPFAAAFAGALIERDADLVRPGVAP